MPASITRGRRPGCLTGACPGRHYGSSIVFLGDGTLLMTAGDRGLCYPSQGLTNPVGSVIRLNEDGGALADNPFVGQAPGNLRPEIFSFSHRNNQGLVINPRTGEVWATDHGRSGGDLLYRIEAGVNFGWPHGSCGTEYGADEKIGIGRSAEAVFADELAVVFLELPRTDAGTSGSSPASDSLQTPAFKS